MATFDAVVLALLLISVCLGAWRGLIYELFSLVGWVVAFFIARLLAPELALHITAYGPTEPVAYALGFVAAFIVMAFVWGLVSALARKMVDAAGLRPVDRTLGACFGALRAMVVLLVVTVVIVSTSLGQSDWWGQSLAGQWLRAALAYVLPTLPSMAYEWGSFLPS